MQTLFIFLAHFSPTLVAWLQASKYILLFIGCIIEGPILMMVSGFLYRLGGFDLLPMYFALMSGDFVADLCWYAIGRYGARTLISKYGHWFGITQASIAKVEDRFHRYHEKILIISKLTMGFGLAIVTLMVAGMLKVPFKNYVLINLFGGFVWTAMLVAVGYFFGNIYALISGPEKIVFAVLIIVAWIAMLRFANQKLLKANI